MSEQRGSNHQSTTPQKAGGHGYGRESHKPEALWREALGRRFRAHRTKRGEKLIDTAQTAGVSPQYLSEVERGRKEPSSEMIAAIAGALDTSLIELTSEVSDDLHQQNSSRDGGALLMAV